MIAVILIILLVIFVIYVSNNHNQANVNDKRIDTEKKTHIIRREPLSETAIKIYTANMDEAYDRLRKNGGDVYPGFPWGAVLRPDDMRYILLGNDYLCDIATNYDLYHEGVGRFKLSVQAYANYGVFPTTELVDYMDKHQLNPDLDLAMAWYMKMHR